MPPLLPRYHFTPLLRKQQVCNNCHSYVTNQNPPLRRLQRPHSRHVRFGEEFRAPFCKSNPGMSNRSLVTILTELIIMNGVTAEISGSTNLKAAVCRVCRSVIWQLLAFRRSLLPPSSGTKSDCRQAKHGHLWQR